MNQLDPGDPKWAPNPMRQRLKERGHLATIMAVRGAHSKVERFVRWSTLLSLETPSVNREYKYDGK